VNLYVYWPRESVLKETLGMTGSEYPGNEETRKGMGGREDVSGGGYIL